ncbi:MAG: amidohydrolase family protein, partial [Bacteroidota bacterium]
MYAKYFFLSLISIFCCVVISAQQKYFITADRLFDGESIHADWALLVEGNKIVAVGPKQSIKVTEGTISFNYGNATVMPGMIEGHSHLLLYPYNITDWDTQVLKETDAYRTIRATVHAKNTLLAGFTTARDLGTEGAGYSDVSLKKAINDGIIIGPRLLVAGRAIVSTGSYGPKGYDTDQQIMLGAEPADGNDLIRVVRDQIGKGADFIKIYADYRWGMNGEDRPSFTLDELKLINEVTRSSGRVMVCHAKSKEAIKRAVLAGAETIEHGDFIDVETGKLLKEHNVTFIPTISAVDAISQYRGWKKGVTEPPANVINKRKSFKEAIASGVTIGMGGDVGVFPHGENASEMELMVEYGLPVMDALKAATSINARAFHLDDKLGSLKQGFLADVVVVSGDP